MVSQDKASPTKQVREDLDKDQLMKRLDMLEERLDSMDSIMMSLVERVMGRPLVMEVSCPNCGQTIQINVTSGVRLRGKE